MRPKPRKPTQEALQPTNQAKAFELHASRSLSPKKKKAREMKKVGLVKLMEVVQARVGQLERELQQGRGGEP